jgi:hypothetical protein
MERARRTLLPALAVAVAVAAVAVAATALAWYRLGPLTRATVWAEDGGPFFRDRLADGAVGSLLQPYAGYLHLLPRLVVDLGFARPIEQYAVTVAGACCAIAGLVAAAVFVLARDVVPAWPLRLVLAAVPVVVPVVPFEISGNAANLHWFMLVLAPWLFAHRARAWWDAALVAVLALGAVLTEPQTLLFAPLLAVAWWRPRPSRAMAIPVTLAVLIGGTAQIATALTTHRASRPGDPTAADVVHGYLLQPLAGSWTRDVGAVAAAVDRHGVVVLVVPVLAIGVLLVGALVVGTWRARFQVLALGVGSVAVWTAALVANASADGQWGERAVADLVAAEPSRYGAASAMLLVSAVVVAAAVLVDGRSWSRGPRGPRGGGNGARGAGYDARGGGHGARGGGRRWAGVAGAVVGWVAIAFVVAAAVGNVAPGQTQRSDGPAWGPQITGQLDACRADPSGVVHATTAPWGTTVPCALVLRGR